MFSSIIQDNKITVVFNGDVHTIGRSHPCFTDILAAVRNEDLDRIGQVLDIASMIIEWSSNVLSIQKGQIYYNDKPVHNVVASKILDAMSQGVNVDPLVMFLENILDNPSKTAQDELYLFLQHNNLSITKDGHFLAYKHVRENYTDHHTGKIDNYIGQVVQMERGEVDDNRECTCSSGLHFCGYSYIESMYGSIPGHTMIVKINPRDVVSIPSDYDNAKGRCCKYQVVAEHDSTADGFTKVVHDDFAEVEPSVEDVNTFKAMEEDPRNAFRPTTSFTERLFKWINSRS